MWRGHESGSWDGIWEVLGGRSRGDMWCNSISIKTSQNLKRIKLKKFKVYIAKDTIEMAKENLWIKKLRINNYIQENQRSKLKEVST